jgi:hypothetical protein
MGLNDVTPAYKISSVTGMKPALLMTSTTILAEHTDTNNIIQVNSGSNSGSGFTISLLNSDIDIFESASVK